MSESLTGKLLIASPKLEDPNFHRTVVLICAHDPDGAFGLILNRPVEGVDLGEQLPGWGAHASPPGVAFLGGPVEQAYAVGLAWLERAEPAEYWRPLPDGRVGLIALTVPPDELVAKIRAFRLFTGYAGWSPGQLEQELAEDAWFVVDARPGDAFSPHPERLWRDVLRRQHGRLAMFALYPSDPSQN